MKEWVGLVKGVASEGMGGVSEGMGGVVKGVASEGGVG